MTTNFIGKYFHRVLHYGIRIHISQCSVLGLLIFIIYIYHLTRIIDSHFSDDYMDITYNKLNLCIIHAQMVFFEFGVHQSNVKPNI